MNKLPKEIEVKFRIQSKEFGHCRRVLENSGFKKPVFDGVEHNFYFDTKDGALKKAEQVLRVRKWDKNHSLTFKSDVSKHEHGKYKVRTELQTNIADANILIEILKQLGFKIVLEYKKRRAHYDVQGAYVELDRWGGNYFVEIEGTKKEINRWMHKLDLKWSDRESRSYVEIIKTKKKK